MDISSLRLKIHFSEIPSKAGEGLRAHAGEGVPDMGGASAAADDNVVEADRLGFQNRVGL
jgi:hypothetical protein